MNPRREFLATIAGDDSDLPRLVYSDWLRDQGEEDHADLIRVQVARAKLPAKDVESTTTRDGSSALLTLRLTCGGEGCKLILDMPIHSPSCEWERLRKREAELLKLPTVSPSIGMTDGSRAILMLDAPTWDRGLIVGLTVHSHAAHFALGWTCERHPIRTLRLTDWLGIDRSLPPDPATALPWLRRLELPRSAMRFVLGLGDCVRGESLGERGHYAYPVGNFAALLGRNPDGTPRVSVEFWEDAPRQNGDIFITFQATEDLAIGDVVALSGDHSVRRARGDESSALGVVASAPGPGGLCTVRPFRR